MSRLTLSIWEPRSLDRGLFLLIDLERKIIDGLRDIAGGRHAGGRRTLGRKTSFGTAAVTTTAFSTPAAQQLDALHTQGQGYTLSTVILRIGPYFRRSFCVYLCSFFKIGSDTGAVGPIGAFYPNGLVLLIALRVTELLGMCHVEIDHVLPVHCIGDTIFTQVSDYL